MNASPRPRGMDRRYFMLALSAGVALFGASPARAECGGPSKHLYQKQSRLLAENAPPGQDDFLELFSRGMRALMRAPRRPGRNVSLGPVLNAFFGRGVLPRTEVAIGPASSPIAAKRIGCWCMSCWMTAGISPTSSTTTARA